MRLILLAFCAAAVSLAGCVSLGQLPNPGYNELRDNSHYVIPSADERGGLENDRANVIYSVSVPFYKW